MSTATVHAPTQRRAAVADGEGRGPEEEGR